VLVMRRKATCATAQASCRFIVAYSVAEVLHMVNAERGVAPRSSAACKQQPTVQHEGSFHEDQEH